MRFEFYSESLSNIPKLSVDGTVPNSIHFSHWEGNQTPAEVKADTSTEIALNLVSSPNRAELTRGIELVTNNHFDTDGVLSVWTVLTGERALELRENLIAAAEVGDFSEFPNAAAIRASIVIQGGEQASNEGGSPLAAYLAGEAVKDDARAYDLVLPEVQRILNNPDAYELLWRGSWERIETAIESFERGASIIEEYSDAGLCTITLAADAFGNTGFDPHNHAIPYSVISRYASGQLYLIGTPMRGGWYYQIDYPYYSWADTVVRPRIPRRDLSELFSTLNNLDQPDGEWRLDHSEMTSAAKFLDTTGNPAPSRLQPEQVAELIAAHSKIREAAVSGA